MPTPTPATRPTLLQPYAAERFAVLSSADEPFAAGRLAPDRQAEARDASLWPILRADRVLCAVCTRAGLQASGCANINFAAPPWVGARELAEAKGLCGWGRKAPLSMVALLPRPLPEE